MKKRASARNALRQIEHALDLLNPVGQRPETATRRRAETIMRLLRRAPAAVLIADNRGRYIEANGAAGRLTGYTRAELTRMAVWDLTPMPRQTSGRRLWRQFLANGRMSGLYQIRHKSGRIVKARYFAVTNVLPGVHVSALAKLRPRSTVRAR